MKIQKNDIFLYSNIYINYITELNYHIKILYIFFITLTDSKRSTNKSTNFLINAQTIFYIKKLSWISSIF